MTFTEAIEAGFRNYVDFSGRASRSEFWYWNLFLLLAQLVLAIVDYATGIGVLTALFALATLIPNIAVQVRRLHDIDRSGWFVLIGLIPLVGIIIVIVWWCQLGTPGPNRFGAPRA